MMMTMFFPKVIPRKKKKNELFHKHTTEKNSCSIPTQQQLQQRGVVVECCGKTGK
jgi:hypothetical protein